jgi:methylmalonyl-CoA/ethylmalonyl-CoA epimerase
MTLRDTRKIRSLMLTNGIQVDDVYAAIKDLTAKNIRALNPEPKIGAHNKPVVFLHPKDCGGVLVELEQR